MENEIKQTGLVSIQGEPLVIEHTEDQLVEMSESHLQNYEYMANNIDRFITAKEKMWQAVLKIVKSWVIFGETADFGWSDADRIASIFGISYLKFESWKEKGTDEKGDFYTWWTKSTAVLAGKSIEVFGRCSSRDKFFGKEKGEFKPLYEINEGNIQMAAIRNCRKEGVRALMGISRIPVAELKAAGVKLTETNSSAVDFKKDNVPLKEGEVTDLRNEITRMLGEIYKKDPKLMEDALQTYTSFFNKEKNEQVKGKRLVSELSEKQLPVIYGKIKNAYEKRG